MEIDHSSRHCGHTQRPWSIITSENTVFLRFNAFDNETFAGFEAVWTPTTAPPSFNFDIGYGCENCNFPFMYEDRRYQSCGSLDGDEQAYCTNGIIPPTEDGTHISLAAPTKIPCYDRDSSCHRTPQMSTHPDNKHGNCCKYLRNGFLKLTFILIIFSFPQIVECQI